MAAATDTARGRRPHAPPRGRDPGGGASAAPGPRRTLPLAVPPLTPIRKGSPPLGCWWFCRVCSLSPAMARAAPPPAACANRRTLPARVRARAGLPLLPAAATGRCPGRGCRRCLRTARSPVLPFPEERRAFLCPLRPSRFTSQAEVSVMLLLQSGRAAHCYSPRRRRRGVWPPPPPLPGPAATARGLWERCEPDPPPYPPG